MPTALTYPGVYIEEVPSGVHTITGVATSIAAFVGYTPRGPVNEPVHIFSFADYERAFGGLSVDSVLSYCVKQFFENGGNEAYVVRVAQNAKVASVTMKDVNGANSLVAEATTPGLWGNGLQIDVDYATTNPSDLFNMTISEYAIQGGVPTLVAGEVFRNLSMYQHAPNAAETVVNAGSQLIQLTRDAVTVAAAGGTSLSGANPNIAGLGGAKNRITVRVDGDGPWDVDITPGLDEADTAADIEAKINAVAGAARVTAQWLAGSHQLEITSADTAHASSVQITDASANNAAGILKLGLANGGTEVSGWGGLRPEQTGTVAETPDVALTGTAHGVVTVEVYTGAGGAPLESMDIQLLDPSAPPASLAELATTINSSLQHASMSHARLAGATAALIGDRLRISPGPADPNASFLFANTAGGDTTAADLGLVAAVGPPVIAVDRNVARYAPGAGVTVFAQVQGQGGNDGTPPLAADLTGDEAAKTGIYALANVDLFNLLVMPDVYGAESDDNYGVMEEAIAYCERRRAMMIIDAPSSVNTFAKAQTWITGSKAGSLRSRNSALYFPRIQAPDPLQGVINPFPAAGAIAGVFARTDAERGVWKAPAGTNAMIAGATGLTYTMTDGENGALNPVALNGLRTFPVIGTVVWGARTARGADVLADDYKYIPVRRLALFLEESLYRGTQWVVFEPNDEPLWAQIRLNLGAFMHGLYAQGAFEGSTPKDAYFVRCDHTTTTQNDIDLGRVNIVVGFAPLKPAEFVVIQIQQIAGAIQT